MDVVEIKLLDKSLNVITAVCGETRPNTTPPIPPRQAVGVAGGVFVGVLVGVGVIVLVGVYVGVGVGVIVTVGVAVGPANSEVRLLLL